MNRDNENGACVDLWERCVQIDDLEDIRLTPFLNLKERTLRGESLFIAEGELVVERLLLSSYKVDALLMTRKSGCFERIANFVPDDVPIYYVDERRAMNRLLGFEFHQGVLALGRRSETPSMTQGLSAFFSGEKRRRSENGESIPQDRLRAWVILPDATKPDNLGLAFRCAAALDAEAVILGERCCDPFSRRALRVSMGGVLQTPIYQARSLVDEIREVKNRWNIKFCATVLDDEAASLYDFAKINVADVDGVAFVFGNEYSGLTPEFVNICDYKVMIPMRSDVDSLNLGVSIGIFLYEFNRLR